MATLEQVLAQPPTPLYPPPPVSPLAGVLASPPPESVDAFRRGEWMQAIQNGTVPDFAGMPSSIVSRAQEISQEPLPPDPDLLTGNMTPSVAAGAATLNEMASRAMQRVEIPTPGTLVPGPAPGWRDTAKDIAMSRGLTRRQAESLFGGNTAPLSTGILDVIPATGMVTAGADAAEAASQGDLLGAGIAAIGALPGGKSVSKAAKALPPVNPRAVIGGNQPPAHVITGSLNPLDEQPFTFNGKQPSEFNEEDYRDIGDHFGVPNLGGESPAVPFKYEDGSEFELPGGLLGTFTYWDMLKLKANAIDPSRIPRALHTEIQKKMLRSVAPSGNLSDAQVWAGLTFGMTSPNNPLFPNQLSQSRLRLRDPKMLDDLAGMISWGPGETVDKETRKAASDKIAANFGLAGKGKVEGGLGSRGSADYTRIAELAKMFRANPGFFRRGPNEQWDHFVERVSSQVAGLSMKTGSFGTVWQDPATAAISAIDRHMAQQFEQSGGLFRDEAQRLQWEGRTLKKWNEAHPDRAVETFLDLRQTDGANGHIGYELLQYVGDAKHVKLRDAKGNYGKNVPAHMQGVNWANEPEKIYRMGEAYRRALALNDQMARANGLGLFGSQWMEWDRIRRRLEPHENMFPGLENIPAPSRFQLSQADLEHRASGHKTYGKVRVGEDASEVVQLRPTKQRPNPARFGYFGIAGAPAAAHILNDKDQPDG